MLIQPLTPFKGLAQTLPFTFFVLSILRTISQEQRLRLGGMKRHSKLSAVPWHKIRYFLWNVHGHLFFRQHVMAEEGFHAGIGEYAARWGQFFRAPLYLSGSAAPARTEPGPPGQLPKVPTNHKLVLPSLAVAKVTAAIWTTLF